MADTTSVSLRIRTADAAAFDELFGDVSPSDIPRVSDVEDGQFVPDFATVCDLGLPFYGSHGSHTGTYSAYQVAFDGVTYMEHPTDEDGNLAIPGLLDPDNILEPRLDIPDATMEFIDFYRRCVDLVHFDPASLYPENWNPSPNPDQGDYFIVGVPAPLIRFARNFYGKPESRVIAEFYGGEEVLIHLEDIADDREALLAEGWPARFLDLAEDYARQEMHYIRLTE